MTVSNESEKRNEVETDGLDKFSPEQIGRKTGAFGGARLLKFVDGHFVTREGEEIGPDKELIVLGLKKVVQKFVGRKLLDTIIVPDGENGPNLKEMNDAAPREEWGVDLNNNPVGPYTLVLVLKLINGITLEKFCKLAQWRRRRRRRPRSPRSLRSRAERLPRLAGLKPTACYVMSCQRRFAMSDVVVLRDIPIDLNSDIGHQFVVDCTRAGEGLLTDKELQEQYELSPVDWMNITKDVALGRAIRAERERRVHNGTAAREAAAKHFVKAPSILDRIMTDEYSNPRHKIEAIRELRQTAAGDNTNRQAESDRFIIRIDLTAGGGDVETYNKSIKVDPTDGDGPNNLIPLEGRPDGDK